MKRVLLVSLGLIVVGAYAGCLPEDSGTTTTGTAGTTGQAGNGSPGNAGTTGAAGDTSTAGTTGSGGDPTGNAGTGGTTGIAGTTGSGGGGTTGQAGTGGMSGTTGMAGSTAGTTGMAGSMAGRGGTTGMAGSQAGTTGMAGRGGTTGTAGTAGSMAGTTGTGGLPSVSDLFPSGTDGSLDGRLLTMPCGENTTGTDCASGGADYRGAHIACSGNALNAMHTYPVGGVTGRQYKVTIHFYGIAEPKNYGSGVTREATGTTRPNNSQTNGGMSLAPTPWAQATTVPHSYPASDYNTNEIHVYEGTTERAAYYLNADTQEGHWTYVINYAKQITVYGGGTVRVRNYDRNCRQIKNCGSVDSYPCDTKANQRVITIPATVMPAVPAGALTQPNLSSSRNANNAGQWLLIDVESVDSQM